MAGKAVISLTTGLEDAEKVTVAFLVAVGAAESGRPTLMFLTKEAVRIVLPGYASAVACDGCPRLRVPSSDCRTASPAAISSSTTCNSSTAVSSCVGSRTRNETRPPAVETSPISTR